MLTFVRNELLSMLTIKDRGLLCCHLICLTEVEREEEKDVENCNVNSFSYNSWKEVLEPLNRLWIDSNIKHYNVKD